MRIAAILVLVASCGGAVRSPAPPSTGAIAGLARDHDSGDPVARAQIQVRRQAGGGEAHQTSSDDHGLYDLDHLPPGAYQLTARFAGQPVKVVNIDVLAGQTRYVDVVFTLGRPVPLLVDYGDARRSQIGRYRPPNLAVTSSIIEGTINDASTRDRVAGAVITAVMCDGCDTLQTISDDQGRFRFDGVAPGTYAVSAYYNIGGRGQVEVRRSAIAVAGAEAVVVPLWIETLR